MRHLNNVVFLRYFETARIRYLGHLVPAHDPANPETSGFGLIFAECHIAYRSPVHFDENLEVHCGIADVRRSSFRVTFEMKVGDRLAAEGWGVLVGYDYDAHRSQPLPEPLRARLLEESEAI
jgi:acyl-CoA thioester hydrolase